jgi:hypothetical protein
MVTIEEDYVSFETAKLLKEKGFDKDWAGGSIEEYLNGIEGYSLPTLAASMKWLREVYNFHIWVEPNHDKEGLYNAHVKVGWWSNNWAGVGYNTYEKATEEAIKYCLKHLIK